MPNLDHTPVGSQTLPVGEMNEQQLILELMARRVSVRLLLAIGLPEARLQHLRAALEESRARPIPSEIDAMTEQELDVALIRRGLSIRLLHLIGIEGARVAAKRIALRESISSL